MKRILVIEDEAEMRRNLVAILRLERFQPLAAEDGQLGVELAKREKPDLVLCDVMMPRLDGYGVFAALRASRKLPPSRSFFSLPRERNPKSVPETLLWLSQGKSNTEIATILGNGESTVKKHVLEIFEKLGVETRTAASPRALEVLSSPAARS